MKTMLFLALALLAAPLTACGPLYENIWGRFVESNRSSRYTIVLVQEGQEIGPNVGPGGSTNFNHKITVSQPKFSDQATMTEPRTKAFITVQVRVRGTNILTQSMQCEAGEGLVTHVEFTVYDEGKSYEYQQINCWTAYPSTYDRTASDSTKHKLVEWPDTTSR